MRLMKRNLKPVYYRLYNGKGPVKGADGYETGETEIIYSAPVKLMCNVSPAKGEAQTEMFGTLDGYDKVIITDDMACPIDENSVLYVDTVPRFANVHRGIRHFIRIFGFLASGDLDTGEQAVVSPHDYIVKRVARSLNHISIAISKVKVS